MVPNLSQMNPAHTFPCYYPSIYSNIILPPMPTVFAWSRPFMFSDQNFVFIPYLLCVLHAPTISFSSQITKGSKYIVGHLENYSSEEKIWN